MARPAKPLVKNASAKTTVPKRPLSSRVVKKRAVKPSVASQKKSKAPKKPSAPRLTRAVNTSAPDFIVHGTNDKALFTLTAYRGEGMCLIAMNWKQGMPPTNFVGFAIEYQEPNGTQFYPVSNRIAFPDPTGRPNTNTLSSRLSPIQKFRWIHFPFHAGIPGVFIYRVHPVFMDAQDVLSYGDFQEAGIELEAETYPGELNICFTRGFISSQAFVRSFGTNGGVGNILPTTPDGSITFKPTDPQAEKALAWMGFEARSAILGALDAAIADQSAQVRVAAYDCNDPEIVSRLQQLKGRLKIIIDDSGAHKPPTASESVAADMLAKSVGAENVQRQHMGGLQHNKCLIVNGNQTKIAIGGSTNFSWRGLYVQNNNAVVLQGENAVRLFNAAFDNIWANSNKAAGFSQTTSARWNDLGFANLKAQVSFSPHNSSNSPLQSIATDINSTQSSLFYSLAFLWETPGVVEDAIKKVTGKDGMFVYGLSDKSVGGLDLQLPNGNPPIAFPSNLFKNLPPPFQQEASGSTGITGVRMHHKFVVIDFNKPTARVYTGSYNFSAAADSKNAENLLVIRDQRAATSYMIEALSMFDHYEFRDLEAKSTGAAKPIELRKPPAAGSSDKPWWDKYWSDKQKEHDRQLFGI